MDVLIDWYTPAVHTGLGSLHKHCSDTQIPVECVHYSVSDTRFVWENGCRQMSSHSREKTNAYYVCVISVCSWVMNACLTEGKPAKSISKLSTSIQAIAATNTKNNLIIWVNALTLWSKCHKCLLWTCLTSVSIHFSHLDLPNPSSMIFIQMILQFSLWFQHYLVTASLPCTVPASPASFRMSKLSRHVMSLSLNLKWFHYYMYTCV